ncbi:retinol dehydrogenase 12 [Triplophysa dalaica]|uniref:retinol dehydrogenase 12 n=1 Tax=Triplophysa dalaica TaxID=1582913 RepID=UPI0024DF7141|nr:retinol dehydrogenase 12 [Triplophysa dalaica]
MSCFDKDHSGWLTFNKYGGKMNTLRGLFFRSWSSDVRLDGKTAIVTGANTGIGKETAKDLAKRGARVILACRDMFKADQAASDIRREVENAIVVTCKLDLADTKSICDFAELIYNTEKSLNFLINNAAVAICPYSTTADGFEMQFGVNHLGHFFLTFLLMDLLKHSAPSKVINVSSLAHSMGKINFEDLNSEKSYHPVMAYVQSKLANVLFTRELARKVEEIGVSVYAVNPGVVKTDLVRHMKKSVQFFVKTFGLLIKTPAEGAYTTLYCALTPGLPSGAYYSDCAVAPGSRAAIDNNTASRLWAASCHLLGIRWR